MATAPEDAEYQLRRLLLTDAAGDLMGTPWAWEGLRWRELVFALLSSVMGRQDAVLRALVARLDDLELLHIRELAAARGEASGAVAAPLARQIKAELVAGGFEPEQAEVGFDAIVDAAHGLATNHGGRVQIYMRRYGEQILNEMEENFAFRTLGHDDALMALTVWLQNCFNLPVSLNDEAVRSFCTRHGIGTNDLRNAADRLGVNLALIDDLVLVVQAEERSKARSEQRRSGHGSA